MEREKRRRRRTLRTLEREKRGGREGGPLELSPLYIHMRKVRHLLRHLLRHLRTLGTSPERTPLRAAP